MLQKNDLNCFFVLISVLILSFPVGLTAQRARDAARLGPPISVSDITLQCTLLKQDSFSQPGVIKVKYLNTGSDELAFQFRLQLVATNGAKQSDSKGGLAKLRPNAPAGVYSFPAFMDEQAVNKAPVYPASCLIDQIEVCPANPPAGHVGYYNPFFSPRCVKINSVGPVNFDAQAGSCTAISTTAKFTDGYGTYKIYAIGEDPASEEGAVAAAATKLANPNYQIVSISKGCGHAHGAIAASLKNGGCYGSNNNCPIIAPGIYEEYGSALADSREEAERLALAACHATPRYVRAPYIDRCQPLQSW
jgi:hypothetical protein